ncbi:MAG: tetratricopeptide repeat protein [Tatlockia sp.]|nr:tetratricopeptide repeat protein [Tatlockia sp.]
MQTKLETTLRLNPAYYAVETLLKNKIQYFTQSQFHKNQKGVSYCTVPLPQEEIVFSIQGKSFKPLNAPHISIYQYYKKNESRGLSVFHFTWYGQSSDNHIVLHVYFDRVGRYLYSQAKKQGFNEKISITLEEEQVIQKFSQVTTKPFFDNILLHITGSYSSTEKLVGEYLIELDNLSKNIKTQFPKYKLLAEKCIKTMEEKDLWTFGSKDPRLNLLKDIVVLTSENWHSQKNNTQGFYSKNTKSKIKIENPPDNKNPQPKKLTSKNEILPANLIGELNSLDDQIIETKNSQLREYEKILTTLALLNRKFSTLSKGSTIPFIENQLIKVLQQINSHYKNIASLFKEEALKGNLEAVKTLRPFIFNVDIFFLAELLEVGDVELCKFVVQEFDECIFYLNCIALGYSGNKANKSITAVSRANTPNILNSSYTLLQRVFIIHKSPRLLEMLLQNGANPNFHGASEQQKGLLYLAVSMEKENFVQMLLENGAETNPDTSDSSVRSLSFTNRNMSSATALSKSIRDVQKKNPICSYSNEFIPLQMAIETRNKKIIALLLQFGASVTKKDKLNFDAIGYETCHVKHLPDLEIVSLLVKSGADINSIQGDFESNSLSTPLMFACQRNDINAVKGLIELGANPNQLVLNNLMKNNKINFEKLTPFHKAIYKGHNEISYFLLEQQKQPLSYDTLAMTIGFSFKNQKEIQFETETGNPALILTPMIVEIINRLFECDEEQRITGLTLAYKQGELHFKEKNYEQALTYFYVYLIFGGKEQRDSAYYNLASCYKNNGQKDNAIMLYKICIERAPGSSISVYAECQLNKLIASKPEMQDSVQTIKRF